MTDLAAYGRELATTCEPLTAEQIEQAARILAAVDQEQAA